MTSPLKKPRRSLATKREAPKRATVSRRTARTPEVEPEAQAPEPLVMDEPKEALFQQGLILPHHKRQLIMHHATARKARAMPHKWLYIMGVATSCLIVAAGWWATVGTWIQGQITLASQPGIQEDVRTEVVRIQEAYPLPKPTFTDAKDLLSPGVATATTSTIDNAPSRERP